MSFPVRMIYKQKQIRHATIRMYGDFIGGFGDMPDHWKLVIKYETEKRIWLFEQEDFDLTGKEVKQMVLDLYDNINSGKIVDNLLQEQAYKKSVLQLLPFDYFVGI